MARPKKNGTYLNVCIETPLYERLEALCEDVGQTKTVAVERALALYLEDYEEKQKNIINYAHTRYDHDFCNYDSIRYRRRRKCQ